MSDDIRKTQITGTFGVGSLRVQLGGLSMIAAGLDHWYQDYTLTRQMQNSRVDKKAYKIFESRLQSYLDVDYFMEPPVFIDSNTFSTCGFNIIPSQFKLGKGESSFINSLEKIISILESVHFSFILTSSRRIKSSDS